MVGNQNIKPSGQKEQTLYNMAGQVVIDNTLELA